MELVLLARQHERSLQGQELDTRITSVFIVTGGLFADAHSHPWLTTPLLKSRVGRLSMWAAQRSTPLWSPQPPVYGGAIER